MVQASYSNERLLEFAKKNYNRLVDICKILEKEGYWEQPQQVIDKTVYETLNLYIQAMLINLSVYCGRLMDSQKKFIKELPDENAIGLDEDGQSNGKVIDSAKRLDFSPPLLLQLCGVRDREKHTAITSLFFDGLLNIMLALASLDQRQNEFSGKYIQEYYQRVRVFLDDQDKEGGISPRYIFRKLSGDWMEMELEQETQKKGKWEEAIEKETAVREQKALKTVKEEKVLEEMEKQPGLEELVNELNQLIGLKGVKEEIHSLINLIRVRKLRKAHKMPSMDMTYHMVFAGNPGTGKTTVARLVAGIYRELGILSKGTLVETDRAGLVAGYVGQTALKVTEVVKEAIGGVLFIDEAYSLTNSQAANDYGREAVDTLVKLMEDNRDDLVVIVAGYSKEMKKFLHSNTGLVSRFNKFIEFPDYTVPELLEILEAMAQEAGVYLTEEARGCMEKGLSTMGQEKARLYGNGRGIRNSFEKIMTSQANRLVTYEAPSAEDLKRITAQDVVNVISRNPLH